MMKEAKGHVTIGDMITYIRKPLESSLSEGFLMYVIRLMQSAGPFAGSIVGPFIRLIKI
jgi:hypothetical protein